MIGRVTHISLGSEHGLSKTPVEAARLVAGFGVAGDPIRVALPSEPRRTLDRV